MTHADEAAPREMAAFRRSLGQRIVEIRRRLGLSQAELARRLGVEGGRLSHWEKGSHLPSLAQAVDIALALQVGLDELVLGKDPDSPAETVFAPKQRERLAICLRTAMEVLRNDEQRERSKLLTRPGTPPPRRSR